MSAKYFSYLSLALVCTVFNPANAQTSATVPEAVGDGWYVWSTAAPEIGALNCYISKKNPTGSELELMFSLTNKELKVAVNDPDWRSLSNGMVHRISMQFSPEDIVIESDFESINVSPIMRGIFHFVPSDYVPVFLDTFIAQRSVSFSRIVTGEVNREMATFDLTGSANAIASLNNCVGIESNRILRQQQSDPFRD